MTSFEKLRSKFRTANKRVDAAFTRYKLALSKLYLPLGNGEIVSLYDICVKHTGRIENATEISWTFYRKTRSGQFYEKPQPRRDGFSERAWDNYRRVYELVGQDWLDLRDMEHAIDVAVNKREILLSELEDAGINPYADAELWN